jgi:hypothetical protein
MYLRRISDANLWRDESLGRVKSDPRRIGIIPRREERSAFRCRLERFRDDYGDRLISCASAGLFAGVMTSTTPG